MVTGFLFNIAGDTCALAVRLQCTTICRNYEGLSASRAHCAGPWTKTGPIGLPSPPPPPLRNQCLVQSPLPSETVNFDAPCGGTKGD